MKTEAINDEQNYLMKKGEIETLQENDRIKKTELAHQRSELKKQHELMQTSNLANTAQVKALNNKITDMLRNQVAEIKKEEQQKSEIKKTQQLAMAQQISVYERDKARLQGQLQQVKQAQASEKSLYEKRIKDIKDDQQSNFSMAQTAKKSHEA